MKALVIAASFAAGLLALAGPACAQDLNALNLTVEHAWSGVAPCLSKPNTDAAVAARLEAVSYGVRRVDARVGGIAFIDQPAPLVAAFRQITRRASRSDFVAVPRDCHDVLCASDALFGPEMGRRLLLIAAAWRYNASSLGEQTSRDWTVADLDGLIAGFGDMPDRLFPLNGGEYRALVRRSGQSFWTPAPRLAFEVVAEAGGDQPGIVVEDAWDRASPIERRVIVVHELAHEFTRGRSGWRTAWQAAVDADAQAAQGSSRPGVASVYAKRGLDEDFAESVAAYRYIAPLLKRRAPHRYALLRDGMFGGIEYGSAAKCLGR